MLGVEFDFDVSALIIENILQVDLVIKSIAVLPPLTITTTAIVTLQSLSRWNRLILFTN
jgi:hypothetical protein